MAEQGGECGARWSGRVRHPIDLPKGLPHDDPGAELREVRSRCVEGCPRADAWSGVARSTGCRTSSSVLKIAVVQRQRKGIASGSTRPYGATQDGTTTSADDPPRQHPGRRTRVHTKALPATTRLPPGISSPDGSDPHWPAQRRLSGCGVGLAALRVQRVAAEQDKC